MSDKLSRADILTMEAGREMDALVAEHIMGWEEVSPDINTSLLDRDTVFVVAIDDFDVCDGKKRIFARSAWHGEYQRWCPSTDIAAAWEVVEKLRNGGWWVRIKSAMNDELEQLGWAVHIGRWWNREYLGEWALTAPLAICRAALLAVMEAT